MKLHLIILDANVIIECFKLGIWKALTDKYKVHITSIVLHSEVYFFEDAEGNRVDINLESDISNKVILQLEATPEQIVALKDLVNPNFLDRIDDGEAEAIALLKTGDFDEFRYCTGDTRAIMALSSLGIGSLGVSLEELLDPLGHAKKVANSSYTKEAFKKKSAEGFREQDLFLKKK